jgi:hypothetical protein
MLIKILLSILNSRFVNKSPCKYGYINGLDAFSYDDLRCIVKQDESITVKQYLKDADSFKSCKLDDNNLKVLEGDKIRNADIWDIGALRRALTPKGKDK